MLSPCLCQGLSVHCLLMEHSALLEGRGRCFPREGLLSAAERWWCAHRAGAQLSFLQALEVCSSFHPSHNPGESVLLFPSYGWGDGGTARFSDLFKAPRPGSSICPEAPCQVVADTQCGSVAEGGRPAGFMCVWLARKLKDQGPYLSDPAPQETSPEHTLHRPEPLLGRAGALAVGGSQPPVFLLGHLCCPAGGLE